MKKNIFLLLSVIAAIALIVLLLPSGYKQNQNQYELIRIHIRANSNLEYDQNVKYLVRDGVVDYLIPYLAGCFDRKDAYRVLEEQNANIKRTADAVLNKNGYNYSAAVKLVNEYFPVRNYDDIVVESGYYDALVVELGEGTGNNWWCVVYPPLCFVGNEGTGNIKYKSKLKEIIDRYFN